jgi:hypothetical protein
MIQAINKWDARSEQQMLAERAVQRTLNELGHQLYPDRAREQAVRAILEYRPAYVLRTPHGDNWSANAASYAMGNMEGLAIDPPHQMKSLAAFLRWRAGEPDFREGYVKHVLNGLAPVNAAAQLDMDTVRRDFGLNGEMGVDA